MEEMVSVAVSVAICKLSRGGSKKGAKGGHAK